MERLSYFIKRRWMISAPLFLILSLLVYYHVSGRELLYRAEASIAFIGQKGSFIPEAEVNGMRDEGFLSRVSEKIPGLTADDLKKGLMLRFKKEGILSAVFISSSPETARDAVNLVCRLFLKERDTLIKKFNTDKEARLKAVSGEVNGLQSDLNSLQRAIRELKAKNTQVDAKVADINKRLTELRLQKAELLKVFTEKHPDVVSVSDKIESLETQHKDLPDNSALYNKLSAEIDEKAAALSSKQIIYKELQASYKDRGDLWYVKLAEEAPLPSRPIGRENSWYYLWGLTGAFVISILGGVILEAADKRIHTKAEAEERLKVPVIADTGKRAHKAFLSGRKAVFDCWGNPSFLKTYQHIFAYLNVDIFKGNISRKTILITSPEERTSKSLIACNLAFAAARSGEKVLLVDFNFRYPAIGKIFGFENSIHGLSDILRGSSSYRDTVRNLTDLLLKGNLKIGEKDLGDLDNMKILTAGTKVENPLGLFSAKELSDLFKELTDAYGLLIIDSASVPAYPDTLNIIPKVDAVLLAVNKDKTTYNITEAAIAKIKKINGSIAGMVFSHV